MNSFYVKKIVVISTALSLIGNQSIANAQTTENEDSINNLNQSEYSYGMDIHDARGVLTRYLFNNLGLLTQEQSAERGKISYIYDESGNITHQVAEGGLIFKRDHDDQNRIIKEVMKQNGENRKVNRFVYDNCENGTGRLCKVVSNGNITKYSYNENGKYTKIQTKYVGEDDFETTRYSYTDNG